MTIVELIRKYLLNVLVGIDQLGNALLGGCPDETISSALGKADRGDYGPTLKVLSMPLRVTVDGFFYLLGDKNHCHKHIENDEGFDSIWKLALSQYLPKKEKV